MDKNGEIPWSCLAPGGAWKAEIWHTSDETAVLARRRGSSDLRLPDAAPIRQCSTSDGSTTGARDISRDRVPQAAVLRLWNRTVVIEGE
jgi:hypothetical protein